MKEEKKLNTRFDSFNTEIIIINVNMEINNYI